MNEPLAVSAVHGASIVGPDGPFEGWLSIADGRIAAINSGPLPVDSQDLGGGWLLPGFVDLHCHGADGADFAAAKPTDIETAARGHERHGTTAMLASLVTAPFDALAEQLSVLADVIADGDSAVIGTHLEGPFLSQARCGAQNPRFLAAPDRRAFADLVAAARGTLRMITIAPELPGALDLIDDAIAAGVVAAVGHTDATYEQAAAAFARGATVATHLFNGMRPLHHRDPGPVLAALDAGAACEVIGDGVHVHPAVLRLVAGRDPSQLVLVTDAISATGVGDGSYRLGGQDVIVADGQARLAGRDALAGSTLTMDVALARAVDQAGLSITVAAAATSRNAARVLGLADELGSIEVGRRADLVHLDETFALRGVLRAGRWDAA